MSEKKVKVRAHERVREGQPEHVREHSRTIESRSRGPLSEKPPEDEELDVTATVEGKTDSSGQLKDARVSEVKLRPRKEDKDD